MNIDSIYFRGYSCFKKEWAGFDEIKPINVIIGRNNSGKSHLLDLVESLCGDKPFRREWQHRLSGVLDERSLREVFSEHKNGGDLDGNHWYAHGHHLVNAIVTWEFIASDTNETFPNNVDSVCIYPQRDGRCTEQLSDAIISKVKIVIAFAMNQRNGTALRLNRTTFCRLFADRDITPELADIKSDLDSDGKLATNIIRQFLLTSNEKLPRETIEKDLRDALNLIFEGDGQFSEVRVLFHDIGKEDQPKDHWEIYLSEKKKGLIPLSKSGSGLKTVILVLLNLLVVPKIKNKNKSQFTFAFEELENNLHPALLRRLFQYLEDYAVNEKAKIFLTTHSSIALDLFGVSDNAQIIHVSHDGESARTTTVPTHSNLIKIVSELGARPSDLLQANGLVWVEGPSDRIYLNRWIELYTKDRPKGILREARDYQCVFYGGALLAQVQFASPEDEAAKLANLFQINHNLIVVCDGDREAKTADLKPRVERIREEVEKIDDAHIWITDAKEIENYLPGSVLAEATGLSPLPDPKKYESWSSYTENNMDGKRIDKVDLAISSTPSMTIKLMQGRFDWKEQMKQIVERIDSWNGNSSSEGP